MRKKPNYNIPKKVLHLGASPVRLLAGFLIACAPFFAPVGSVVARDLNSPFSTLATFSATAPLRLEGSARVAMSRDDQLALGKSLATKPWVSAPSSTTARDGLGPHYNAPTCVSCHPGFGQGTPYSDRGDVLPSLVIRLLHPDGEDPIYGRQLNIASISTLANEGRPVVSFIEVAAADVLQQGSGPRNLVDDQRRGDAYQVRYPIYSVESLSNGSLSPETFLAPRRAGSLRGSGYIEQASEDAIRERHDPEDRDGDGISGSADRLDGAAIGRFGWKATAPSLAHQIAGAAFHDMGLTSPLFPVESCTEYQLRCLESPRGETLDLPGFRLAAMTTFAASLPFRKKYVPDTADQGREIFYRAGCESCHREEIALEGGGTAFLFSDLLLHDMGQGLAEPVEDEAIPGSEWRTPPLRDMGSRLSFGPLLHDGRALSLSDAMLWHGGEATESRRRFFKLQKYERQTLIDFLGKL